jgi:hypothetical protein
VAPLRLGGLRGKKSTPSVWLGGTGELLRSASRSSLEQEQLGEGAAGAAEPLLPQVRPRYDFTKTNRVECMVSFAEIVFVLDVNVLKLRKIYIFLIFVIWVFVLCIWGILME